MLLCLGKIHNLPTTIKTQSELAGHLFFHFVQLHLSLPWPALRLSGSHDHTYSLFSLVFTVEKFVVLLCLVRLGSNCSFTSETGLVKTKVTQLTSSSFIGHNFGNMSACQLQRLKCNLVPFSLTLKEKAEQCRHHFILLDFLSIRTS